MNADTYQTWNFLFLNFLFSHINVLAEPTNIYDVVCQFIVRKGDLYFKSKSYVNVVLS